MPTDHTDPPARPSPRPSPCPCPITGSEESTDATPERVPVTRSNVQAWTADSSHRVTGTHTRDGRIQRSLDAPSPRGAPRHVRREHDFSCRLSSQCEHVTDPSARGLRREHGASHRTSPSASTRRSPLLRPFPACGGRRDDAWTAPHPLLCLSRQAPPLSPRIRPRHRRHDHEIYGSSTRAHTAPRGTPLARSASRDRRGGRRVAFGGSACGAARARA